jgi:hypothetical protein
MALIGHADLAESATLDESLLYLKHEPPPALVELPSVAFIGARALARDLTKFTIEALEIASKSLGATAFIDLPAWARKYGNAEARTIEAGRSGRLLREKGLTRWPVP